MKVILYVATSTDGFIAKRDGDSDWVTKTDQRIFFRKAREIGCLILGRKTYDQYYQVFYPLKGLTNIILTSNTNRKDEHLNVSFASSPQEALKIAADLGYRQVLLTGGGLTNASFAKEGLIDELIISIHPLILGGGIRIFEGSKKKLKLKRLEEKSVAEGLVQIRYKAL